MNKILLIAAFGLFSSIIAMENVPFSQIDSSKVTPEERRTIFARELAKYTAGDPAKEELWLARSEQINEEHISPTLRKALYDYLLTHHSDKPEYADIIKELERILS